MKQVCHECKSQIYLTSQRFFCCNESQVVCSMCRRKPCTKCKKPRTIEIIVPKCSRCYSRLYENDLLLQNTCGKYYCSKCLSDLFKNAYFRVMIQKCYNDQNLQLAVKLYCGHEFLYEDLANFFQHFCLSCGRQYNSVIDYELVDGVKLCSICFRSFQQFFQQLLIKCQFCQAIIRNSSYASILDNTQTAICRKCTKQSQISENLISESRKIQQNNFFEKRFEQKPSKFQGKQQFQKPSVQTRLEQVPKPNKVNLSTEIDQKEEQISPLSSKSPLTKLFKRPSISQLKQKQQKRSSNASLSNSISVTSRFSNNLQQIDQEITESLGLPQDFKLKKHLSNETYVQNYLIEIPENKCQDFVKCQKCSSLTQEKTAYDLYDFEEMSKSRATTISFKPNGTISSINKKDSRYFICRVCYFKSSQREKSVLNASISTRPKSSVSSNRHSKLQDSMSSMDFLKPGKSVRKEMRSPSPSPNKQYSLTGSKDSLNDRNGTNSLLVPGISGNTTSSIKMGQQKFFQQKYPMSREKAHESVAQKSMRCDKCRDIKTSLIATIQGYYCDNCYYGRGQYYDPFLGK